MKYTADEIIAARWRLTPFVHEKAQEYTRKLGVQYEASPNAPETGPQIAYHMRQSQYHGRPFPVWSGASDNTIYMNAGGNYAFRFWHDALHYLLSMDTSLVDELELGAMHTGVVMARFGFDSLEAKLMRADTMMQSRYAADHAGNFPEDQLAFVLKCIEDM